VIAGEPAKPRLRILHLHSTFDACGKERRCVALINRFGPGLHHTIVSAQPGAMGARSLIDPAIPVTVPVGFPPLAGRFGVRRLRSIARAMQGYDLVLTYNWGAMDGVMAHGLFAPLHALPPLVHHEDGFNADEAHRLNPRRNWYRRVALARASALVVCSRRLEQVALEDWAQPPARVHRIANGIRTAAYGKTLRPDVLPRIVKRPGERWLGTLAGLRRVKNLPRLVRAFAAMPAEWQLVILGEGPEREVIRAEASRLRIEDRVHLPGHVPDPAAAIGLFDLFALSSDSEQAPLSVLEAMAAGLAVASPAVGDVAEMVSPDNAPFIVAPGAEAALVQALAALGADESLRLHIGEANRQRAQNHFDEKAMAARYAALYAAAMGRQSFP